MKYFVLEKQEGNGIPEIVNWYEKLDVRRINRQQHRKLPRIIMLDIKIWKEDIFPDMLFQPVLLVSQEVMAVIKMYDAEMPYHTVVLMDVDQTRSGVYCLPVLEEIRDGEITENIPLGFITERGCKKILVERDLLESLLYRGMTGVSVKVW